MNELLFLIGGWFGMLMRGSVLLQLAILVAVFLLHQTWKRRRRPSLASWQPLLAKLAAVGILALAAALVALPGMASGLIVLAAQLLAVWTALDALRLILRRFQNVDAVESYWFRAVRPLFLVVALLLFIDRFDGLQAIADVRLIAMFGEHFTVGGAALLVSLPYFLVVLSELPVLFLGFLLQRLMGLSAGNRKVFELIFRYLLIGVGVLWLANQIGLNGTAIAAIAGGLSVGLGFGIKEVFSNIVSGLWLLIEGSVRPGEVLIHDGEACEVRRLGPRATTLWRGSDNAELVVPNQTFFTTSTTTYTHSDRLRRLTINLGVPRRWPPDQIVAVLEAIAASLAEVLADPPPQARLQEFGPDTYLYSLTVAVNDPLRAGAVSAALRLAICRSFADRGVDPPC